MISGRRWHLKGQTSAELNDEWKEMELVAFGAEVHANRGADSNEPCCIDWRRQHLCQVPGDYVWSIE